MKPCTWRSSAARRIARAEHGVRTAGHGHAARARPRPRASPRAPRSPRCRDRAEGRRTSGRSGTPLEPADPLERRVAWEATRIRSRSAASPAAPSSVGSRTTAATSSGNADASADTAPIAPASQAEMDQRLGADEDVEPVEEVARERLPRAVRDLHPGDVGGLLAQPREHRPVERVPARRGELVDVERQWRARRAAASRWASCAPGRA